MIGGAGGTFTRNDYEVPSVREAVEGSVPRRLHELRLLQDVWEVADAPVPLATPEAVPDVQGATAPEAAGEPSGAWGSSMEGTTVEGLAPATATLPYVTADTYTRFFEGYFAAGGLDEERIAALIWCESSWRLDPGGWHLGLAQFDPGTWATVSAITGYTDWRDAFSQGYATATWASMVDPGSRAGWPSCFSAIDW